MSALWRINLWVTACFAVLTLACAGLLLRQAADDIERELQSAEALVQYLGDSAARHPASLQPELTRSLRHVRVHWLAPGETPPPAGSADPHGWLGRLMLGDSRHSARLLDLNDGRRVLIAVNVSDELSEVRQALQQWLGLCVLAWLLSLLSIGWAVRRGRAWLDELLQALAQVSDGQLRARLRGTALPETRQLAEHFNRMASALEQAHVDNGQLTRALLAVQEQERNHLAQTLHDDLGQYLAGIRAQACLLRLVVNQPALVAQTAEALELNCQQLQQGFRAMVQDLYPVVLAHLPLAEALGLLVQQWQARQGIECRLRVGEGLPALSGASKTHLYRLLQEALTNVARHAGASQVRVRLQRSGLGLRLLIRDNGRGAPQARRAGVGLHSMAERARSLGGELRVINRPGAGWALALNMPLEA